VAMATAAHRGNNLYPTAHVVGVEPLQSPWFSSFETAQTCTTMASVSAISSDAMPSNRPNLTLDEQSFQRLLSAAFTIREHNDRRKLARQTPARQTQAKPEPHPHPEPEADRLCQHCGALMPADAGVPPLDAERKPLAPAPRDSAGPSFLGLPVAKEAAKETIRQEKTETIHDRAFDTSALDKAKGKSQWITEATKDLTPGDPAPEDAELTVQPFQLSTRLIAGDEPVTNDAGYGHIAVYRWQWSVSFWPI
jgi:hypothetical protein